MDLVKLKKQIQQNALDRFYCFAGEEISLQSIYLNKMGTIKRVDTVAEIWKSLTTKSKLFKSTSNIVYVVRDDKEFMTNAKLEELIGLIKYNTLILQVTKLDKKTKFYKTAKDYLIEFNPMTTQQLLQTVLNLMPIKDTKLTSQFIEACGNNYGVILSELDKVKYGGTDIIYDLIKENEEYSSFTFIDMLFAKHKDSMKYLLNLLENGESELGIMTLIFNKASQLLQLQQGINPDGLNEWAGKKMLQNNKLSQRELYRATRWTRLYTEGIKSGDYDMQHAVLLCVMKILG